jgi:hypothetical protein
MMSFLRWVKKRPEQFVGMPRDDRIQESKKFLKLSCILPGPGSSNCKLSMAKTGKNISLDIKLPESSLASRDHTYHKAWQHLLYLYPPPFS